jgi:hypothetical protein
MSGSLGEAAAWGAGPFAASVALSGSTLYRLEFSNASGQMQTWPIRHGGLAGYGYSNAIDSGFPGALPWQHSEDGGSTWANGSGNDDQLQAVLEWVA